jgi:hypothetical protein
MKYYLRISELKNVPDVKITSEEYSELENARKILFNAQGIEAKYDILITNYLELEKQILKCAANIMVRSNLDYSSLFEIRQSLNVRLVNLLTSAKLYVDQLYQNVSICIPNVPDLKNRVNALFSSEYDANKEYRFMEALRNYVQHRGIPVHFTQIILRSTTLEDSDFFEYNLEFSSSLSYLKEDMKFKKSVLKELDEKVDLKASTRSYIESLSNIHEETRIIIAESVKEARDLIENTHLRFKPNNSKSLSNLVACKQTEEGKLTTLPLLLDWDDIRQELQKQNRKLINLKKRYITNIVKIDKK